MIKSIAPSLLLFLLSNINVQIHFFAKKIHSYEGTHTYAKTGVTFNAVGSLSFIKIACPKLHVKTPATLSKVVKVKSNIISSLIFYVIEATKEDSHGIGLTSDLWSSRAG